MQNRIVFLSFVFLLSTGAAGCGSEGTDGRLAITSANFEQVASTVWLNNTATDIEDVLSPDAALLLEFFGIVALQPNGSTIDVPCEMEGKAVITGSVSDANNPGRTVGDTVSATYEGCDDSAEGSPAEVVNGKSTLTIEEVRQSGQTGLVVYDGLTTAIEQFGTFEVIGQRRVSIDEEDPNTTVTASADRLTVTGDGETETVENQLVTLVDGGEELGAPFELDFSGTLISGRLGGTVDFETTMTFEGLANGFPESGRFVVTGKGDSSVRVMALDDVDVRLELDEDGDGTPEPDQTTEMTWVSFEDF